MNHFFKLNTISNFLNCKICCNTKKSFFAKKPLISHRIILFWVSLSFSPYFCLKCLTAPQKNKKGGFLLSTLAVGFPRSLSLLYVRKEVRAALCQMCVCFACILNSYSCFCVWTSHHLPTPPALCHTSALFFYRKLTFTEQMWPP